MSSCHFGAMCFLWVSLVVPQHYLAALSLVFPAGLQQGSLFTPPMAAEPGDDQDCHLPMGTGHSHQWTPALFTSSLGQAAQSPPEHTGGTPCSPQKSAICKKRFSNWEWHLILKKLKNGSERSVSVAHWISVLRGCREALAEFSNIILRSCLQILTIPAHVDSEWVQLWSQHQAQEPAGEPAMLFYGKSAVNPQSLGLQCCREHSPPGWQVCTQKNPKKTNGLGTKFDFFVSSYAFFKQAANSLPSGFKV